MYAAGFVYGLMYWAAVTETDIGRKKRDAHSAGDDGFYGQVGEPLKKTHKGLPDRYDVRIRGGEGGHGKADVERKEAWIL